MEDNNSILYESEELIKHNISCNSVKTIVNLGGILNEKIFDK